MHNNLKRCSALLLAVCLFLSVLIQPVMAAELDDDLMMVDETAEDELTEDGEAAASDDEEAASGDAAEDAASDGDEYEYDAPTITAVGTGLETNKFYVYITWDVVGENDYKILRSTDGENYTGVGYASYPGEDETTVTYEDIGADLYETCWYAVCCIDDDGNQVSAYTYTTSGHYYPSGSCGDNVAWSISSDGVLTISGSGKMVDAWEEGYAAWYPIRSVVQTVQIGEGVTSVAPYSFQECANLTSVTIPDTVTTIGDCAFFGCSSLTSVTIPEGVTKIPYRAFYLCTGLTSVSLPSTVTTIGDGAFGSCTSLTDLTLPSGLTSLGKSALYKCTSLTSLVIPDGVTVLPMNALYSCTGLTSLTLPSGLTELGIRALFNCCSLTELTLPETLTTIGSGALQLCTGLTELTIPASVNSIGSYAFYACTGLETVCFLGEPPETLSDWFGDVACAAIVQEEYADAWFALDLTAAGSQVTWSSPVEYLDAPTVSVSNASTGVKVTWGAVEDAEGYDVYRKTSGGWKKLGSTTSTSYTDTTASSGTTYSYTVCAYAGEVISDYGTGCSILYLAQPTVTLSGNPTGVTVKWGAVTGATNYRVYRKVSGGSSWTGIATVSSSTLTYTDTAVEDGSGTTYYYTVQAVNSSTTSSYVTNKSVVRLAQPTVTLSNASTGVTVKWGAVTGATGYTVWRKTSGGSWAKITTASSSTLTYTDTTASSGTTYYYTVRATSSNAISSYVTTKSILRLAQPTVTLSNASTGVTVKWGAVTGATSYRIYRKTVSGSWQNLGSVSSSTLTYTDTAVADSSGTTYYYTVRAVSGSTLGSYDSSKSIVRLAQPTVTLSNASTGVTVKWGAVTG
ncbi:MAG: leucine-rich repeat protein, partial [Clostridiales bacterium]|nr:leucine-rich repeat protein [Clostridiales bacterium]